MVTLALAGLVAALQPADARGRHHGGSGGHHSMADDSGEASRGDFAGDQRHSNDDYVKAAAEQEDKLLDSKIKSICRGC